MAAFHLVYHARRGTLLVKGQKRNEVIGCSGRWCSIWVGYQVLFKSPCGLRVGRRLGWVKEAISLNDIFFQVHSFDELNIGKHVNGFH